MWCEKFFCDILTVLIIITRLIATSPSFVFNQPTAALQRIKNTSFFFLTTCSKKERCHHKNPLVYARSKEDEEFVLATNQKNIVKKLVYCAGL